ncbi:type I polyketide synthase [Nocardioides zeae]|uniref:Acyl transferase domain-containing protein n=1 Tax=Nocardioides zeae TaxID=1457234 RepID=A0AAJ1TVQ0_9ACTN|nr:type I polyketide synthase [Nocardioides zeae]MDQ1102854.1 acyl transferase domain-containing protein [Nocardioides zeae]
MGIDGSTSPADVAVIGAAVRLPGANDLDQYWRNLREGVESATFYTDEELRARGVSPSLLANPNYVRAAAVFEDGEGFDADFFGYTAREAEIMDPQHRHFLEVAYHGLEEAGYDPTRYPGRIGVYAGCTMNTYLPMNIIPNGGVVNVMSDLHIMLGGDKEYLPARVSYKLDLRGPSMAVQTACSSSLTAIHVACQAILNDECDMALAGGVSVRMPWAEGYMHVPGGTTSPDGRCRAFDVDSVGSIIGNGAGVVMLKHLTEALADGDHIYGVIKGTSINNDGSRKVSFTAPSVDGQARAVAGALLAAEMTAEDIGYVEAHGTGTQLGDPIEVAALTQAFRESTDTVGTVALGSVKPNIGHLDAGAGVASFIKAMLVLKNGLLPPVLHFREPNPHLHLEQSPFFVNNELIPWPGSEPRRAGVNSLGMGGSNAHVIIEQPPAQETGTSSGQPQLLLLSAHTRPALDRMSANLGQWLVAHPAASFDDVAYTLQVGRRQLRHRRAVVVRDAEDAGYALGTSGSSRVLTRRCDPVASGVALLLPGQGSQHPGMAARLHQTYPAFRRALDEALADHPAGDELRRALVEAAPHDADAAALLAGTEWTQPAIFAFEYAAARLLEEFGITPRAMLGHSIGEYVAAVVSGVLSVSDGARLVSERARLMASTPPGAMASVSLSGEKVADYLTEGVTVAAVNSDSFVTISGGEAELDEVVARLDADGVRARRLPVSRAFHSAHLDGVLEEFAQVCRSVSFAAPRVPWVSNLTGTWITEAQATDPDYWVQHMRQPVQFARGVATLLEDPSLVLVDIGPGRTLLPLVELGSATLQTKPLAVALCADPRQRGSDTALTFLQALGSAWTAGIDIDFEQLRSDATPRRLSMPLYPFEHQRFWLTPRPAHPASQPAQIAQGTSTAQVAPPFVEPLAATQPAASVQAVPPIGVQGNEDRHPRPDLSTPYAAPRTDAEATVVEVVAAILGLQKIGVNDNFFELHTDSLMALQLVVQLRERYGIDLPVAQVFENPTAAELCVVVEEEVRQKGGATETNGTHPSSSLAPPVTGDTGEQGTVSADQELDELLSQMDPEELQSIFDEIDQESR